MSLLKEIYNLCCENNYPFAAYKLPGAEDYEYIIQLSELSSLKGDEDITKLKGFAFVPFNNRGYYPSVIIKPDITKNNRLSESDIIKILHESAPQVAKQFDYETVYTANKEAYTENVAELIKRINRGEFQKAILSRAIVENRKSTVNCADLFLSMCKSNHNSFISLVHIPGYASWIGATPELLFSCYNNIVTIVSIAGTQLKSDNNLLMIEWDNKNIIEQKIVTDYISDLFSEFNIYKFQVNGPETIEAGAIVHLKTTFTISASQLDGNTGTFIKRLHPTPAVWGQPKTDALNIINKLENYNREYYSGYLGPVNMSDRIDLFVNLRTMKAVNDKFIIYVGSGITSSSDPEKEWEETCLKAGTLLSIINN